MLAATLVVLAVLTIRGRFSDLDLWWHLKTGEVIWNTHSIPRTDLFSWTTEHHEWIPHEWLAELTMYAAYYFGSYTGLMVWFAVTTALLLVLQYLLCSLYSGNPKVALIGGLIAWLFATSGFSIRPQMIGYVLLTCELLILYLGRVYGGRWFLLLPPLFAVWVNCHGSFSIGIVIIALTLLTSFAEFSAGSLEATRWDRHLRNQLAVAAALSVAALFLNPVGIRQVTYPLDVMFKQHVNVANVSEWQPPDPNDPRTVVLFGCAALLFVMVLFRRATLRFDELVLFVLGFAMAVRHFRMFFVFGVLAAPILSRLLANEWEGYDPARDRRLPNAVMLAVAFGVVIAAFPTRSELEAQVRQSNPVGAVEFVRRSGQTGRMLNDYGFGGYLIWALPEHEVFVDGRTDVFEWTGVLSDYGRWALLQQDPQVLLNKYHIDFCFLSKEAPMTHVLPYVPGWRMVYNDEQAAIFRRTAE